MPTSPTSLTTQSVNQGPPWGLHHKEDLVLHSDLLVVPPAGRCIPGGGEPSISRCSSSRHLQPVCCTCTHKFKSLCIACRCRSRHSLAAGLLRVFKELLCVMNLYGAISCGTFQPHLSQSLFIFILDPLLFLCWISYQWEAVFETFVNSKPFRRGT